MKSAHRLFSGLAILICIGMCLLAVGAGPQAAPNPADSAPPAKIEDRKQDPSPGTNKTTEPKSIVPPPSASAGHSKLDDEPIAPRNASSTSVNARPPSLELSRLGLALGMVIILIIGLQWGAKKLFAAGGGKSVRAVQLLARAPIAPRQYVTLLRVGQRVLVIGEAGAQMNALCQITDADEIASLLGQLQEERAMSTGRAFGTLFSLAKRSFGSENVAEHELDEPASNADVEDARETMPDPATAETGVDNVIATTHQEISGLMDKLRSVSREMRS